MQYYYQTFQVDNARTVDDKGMRQFVQCVAGGETPQGAGGSQRVNGGGATMEDRTPRMLLPCNPSQGLGCSWGTGVDASDPPKTVATLNFQLGGTVGGQNASASITAGVSIPITIDGGSWSGAQGPLPSGLIARDPLPREFEATRSTAGGRPAATRPSTRWR